MSYHMRSVVVRVVACALVFGSAAAEAMTARGDVPVPRPAPRAGAASAGDTVMMGSFSAAGHFAGRAMAPVHGPALPMRLAIQRELTVDVSLPVAQFYERRGYRPVWTDGKADAALRRLAAAAGDGLDPADYRLSPDLSPAARDVTLTELVLAYARDAHSGRVRPQSISRIVTMEPPVLDEAHVLRRLGLGADPVRVMESAHPQHGQYQQLREALRVALETPTVDVPRVGSGPHLKRGDRSSRVAILRARLGATVMRGNDPTVFGDDLADAVKAFQRANGLGADGIVGPRTIAALDGVVDGDPVPELISNLERWRWLPRDLGEHHVRVNIPAFRVRVVTDGAIDYDGRVIVGTPSNPTPVFSDVIEHVVVNPYWNVPYSIAKNEMLSGIRANPSGYFARRGYEAVVNGRVVNPASISWDAATLRRVRVRQKPGRGNALGSVKFLFPNKHAVYLHDTTTKHLFKRDRRAYSHGCVRVDQPFVFADALLREEGELTGAGLKRMVGGKQRWLNLKRTIPVHLTYFTREVAPDGTLKRYADVYGYDARTQKQLGL